MKEPGQRWLILPFSLGCASRSSVTAATSTPTGMNRRSHESKSSSIVKKSKYSIGFSLPKPNLSLGIRKLIKHLKSVSQIFGYRDDEEQEAELEIGYPTDVKHLTHIGWDGSTTIPNQHDKGTVNSFPSISLKQFELAMAAQAQGIVTHQ